MSVIRSFLEELEWKVAPRLPRPLARLIGALRGFFVSRTYYSQNAEDILIAKFFDCIGLKNGYCIDIGCFHPRWISNTKLLHDRGWRGLGVDIDKYKVKLYECVRRPRGRAICAAVTNERDDGVLPVYRFHKFWSELDTLSRTVADASGRPFTTDVVRSIHVDDLIALADQAVNFKNIDIEGLDLMILQAINFDRFRPQLICFEGTGTGVMPPAGADALLVSLGYRHLFSTGPSHGYAIVV